MSVSYKRWKRLCNNIGAIDNYFTGRTIESTYGQLVLAYTEPNRHYHNVHHLNDGLAELDEAGPSLYPGLTDLVEMAWWWHDFVYDATSSKNEIRSAMQAINTLTELQISSSIRMHATELILSTAHSTIPQALDHQLIVDMDLASLGASPEVFEKNNANIRKEYNMYSDEEFRRNTAKFFQKFLKERPSVYLTDYFRNKYEAQAQQNIKRAMEVFNG